MQHNGPQSPFEVYCYQCNVTAPLGTRHCVHCGGKLSGPQAAPVSGLTPAPFAESATDEDLPRRLGSASPMTVVWIALFLGMSLFRLCSS